jgi:hypothetical protein
MLGLLFGALVQAGEFRAGAAVVDATPPKFPVVVNGMFTGRNATKALDPVEVRALVLDDGRTRVALAVVDSCMVPRDLIDRAKEASGIPAERVLVSSTHTHSAPSAMGCLGSEPDPDYPAFLEKKIAEAVVQAAARLVPAEIGWAAVQAPDHTHCRRWILRPDRIRTDPFGVPSVRAMMHPGYQNPDFIGPAGAVDPELTMLAVRSRDGKPLALFANFSMHYFGSGLLSADYAGAFRRLFAKGAAAPEGFVAILSQGTSGDQMWMDYAGPDRKLSLETYTQGLVDLALAGWKTATPRADATLAMQEARLVLGRRLCDARRLEWARGVVAGLQGRPVKTQPEIYAREQILLHETPTVELKLQALRIGDAALTAIPNEVLGITGLRLKALSPFKATMNVALANGAEGYIPPPEQHVLGGYVTWAARTAALVPEAEPRIVDTLLALLEEVAGRPRRPFAEPDSPYARALLASRPAAYYRLGEFTGTRAADAAGGAAADFEGGVALHLEGPPLVKSSALNRAPHFAGGRLRSPLAALPAAHSVEVFFWNGLPARVRPVAGVVYSRGDVLGIAGGRLFLQAGTESLQGSTALGLKTWHHVLVVRDGDAVAVFLDGRPEIEGRAPAPAADAPLFLGARADGTDSFEGRLDEAAVFPRALDREELGRHLLALRP